MSASLREQLSARKAALEAEDVTTPETDLDENEEVVVDDEPVEETADEAPAEESADTEPAQEAATAELPTKEEAPAFTADFKYRADGKDLEVPEYLRPLIKDKESQEKIIKMLEKHDSFDTVSSRRDNFRNERDEARGLNRRYEGAINNMKEHVSRGDIDGFLKLCEIPEEVILKYATEKAKYYMGDEQYRQSVDQATRQKQDSWNKEAQVNEYQARYQDLEVRQLQSEFNYEMLKPEVSSFSAAFDKIANKPGAFVEEVKNRGELAYLRERKTIAPGEVIQAMMKQFSNITQVPHQAPAVAPTGAASKVIVKTASKVATIPTVKGSQASATKEGFTSLDAIRKFRKETYGK